MKTLTILLLGLVLAGLWFLLVNESNSSEVAPIHTGERAPMASDELDLELRGADASARQGAARQAEGDQPGPVAADEIDLEALLAAIARAEARGSAAELEALLLQVIANQERLAEVSFLLTATAPEPSVVVRRGGTIAIAVAFARWSRGSGPAGFDAQAFCVGVIRGLPALPAEGRKLLVGFLAGTDAAGAAAIPGSMLPAILSLCREHPDDAATYALLLERLDEDPTALAAHRAELLQLLAGGTHSDLSGSIVRALVALDPIGGSLAARSALDGAERGSLTRQKIVTALAGAAPPAVAVDVIASSADGFEFDAFHALSRRDEAREEVRSRYSALVAANLDPAARRRLVASMSGGDGSELLGIGATDPHLDVRKQAFLTATGSADVGSEGVQAIRDAYDRRAAHGGIDTRCAVLSAANVVLQSRGPARAEALGLLTDIARDGRLSETERRLALDKLRPHLTLESLAELEPLATAAGLGANQAGK